jgi:hypothetical protein
MDAEPATAESASSRPWSVAAAMEPVPPLAPPPASPGKGVPVATTPRPVDVTPGPRMLMALAVLVAAVVLLVVLALVLRPH